MTKNLKDINLFQKFIYTRKIDELQKQNILENNISKMRFLLMINFLVKSLFIKGSH